MRMKNSIRIVVGSSTLALLCAMTLVGPIAVTGSIRFPAMDVGGAGAADESWVVYRKVFKGSTPEFAEIKVSRGGNCTFDIRQLSEDADPRQFAVSDPIRAKIFSLAADLHEFQGVDLDVHRKIANLGEKTFVFRSGAVMHEAKFNYTTNPSATQLYDIFEGLTRQQDHVVTLERRMRYDRLGIPAALTDLDGDLGHKMIPEPAALLPVLDQIAGDSRIVEIARTKARAMAARIRGAK
ncbi:MAG TPA: hypothetical protein VFO34_18040 [Candidatus Acidoferrales bacterium]|nr:hypothetical protein [Candidatus Acidoferrales bacterium]